MKKVIEGLVGKLTEVTDIFCWSGQSLKLRKEIKKDNAEGLLDWHPDNRPPQKIKITIEIPEDK